MLSLSLVTYAILIRFNYKNKTKKIQIERIFTTKSSLLHLFIFIGSYFCNEFLEYDHDRNRNVIMTLFDGVISFVWCVCSRQSHI